MEEFYTYVEQHLYFEYHLDLRSIEPAFQNKSDILGLILIIETRVTSAWHAMA